MSLSAESRKREHIARNLRWPGPEVKTINSQIASLLLMPVFMPLETYSFIPRRKDAKHG